MPIGCVDRREFRGLVRLAGGSGALAETTSNPLGRGQLVAPREALDRTQLDIVEEHLEPLGHPFRIGDSWIHRRVPAGESFALGAGTVTAPPSVPTPQEEKAMAVARVTEISSTSSKSFEDAIQQGIGRATKTLRNVRSAWVKEQRVDVDGGKIVQYQVNLMVTFILDD